jgi:hypothetical protein
MEAPMGTELTKEQDTFRVVVRCERTGNYFRTQPHPCWEANLSFAHTFWSVQDAFRACHDRQFSNVQIVVHREPLPPFVLPLPTVRAVA